MGWKYQGEEVWRGSVTRRAGKEGYGNQAGWVIGEKGGAKEGGLVWWG